MTPLPAVPEGLAAREVGLRAEQPGDADFIRQLYVSVRWEEVSPLPWTDAAKIAFLTEQSRFQNLHYRTHYAGAALGIITRAGTPIGRLYLQRSGRALRIIDISLLAADRGQGIGNGMFEAVFRQARQDGDTVSLQVGTYNHGARRLYERLGFVARSGQDEVYISMDWSPERSFS